MAFVKLDTGVGYFLPHCVVVKVHTLLCGAAEASWLALFIKLLASLKFCVMSFTQEEVRIEKHLSLLARPWYTGS